MSQQLDAEQLSDHKLVEAYALHEQARALEKKVHSEIKE